MTWTLNYIFGEILLLGIAIHKWFAAGTKQNNFNFVLINKKKLN